MIRVAIKVNRIEWHGHAWMVDLAIVEGVYQKDHYPVRIVDAPVPPDGMTTEQQYRLIEEFVVEDVRQHMRRGSLPPSGVQLTGHHLWTVEAKRPN